MVSAHELTKRNMLSQQSKAPKLENQEASVRLSQKTCVSQVL